MYVEEELVFYNLPLDDQNELFNFMSEKLRKKRYVTEGYLDAITNRENEYPTGLKLKGINAAIVHTESVYSNVNKLVVIKPKQSITFKNIEDLQPIEVDLIFGLILNDHTEHLEILKKISQILQEKEVIQSIINIGSQQELTSFMQKHFN